MEKMFNLWYVLIGILAVPLTSGVQIEESSAGDLIFLKGNQLNLTCTHRSFTDESSSLSFTKNGLAINTTDFAAKRDYVNGYSKLYIQKTVVVDDDGTYTCKSSVDNSEDTVTVQVFDDTIKAYAQKRYLKDSTDLIEGETLNLECPVLDKLMADVTWEKSGGLRTDARLSDVGDKLANGKITIDSIQVEDRGNYTCTAKWYSGEAKFSHFVRVKSKLAPLWPAIGIIAEIIVLIVIILACRDKKTKAESSPASAPSTSTTNEKGSRRKYATSST